MGRRVTLMDVWSVGASVEAGGRSGEVWTVGEEKIG